MNISRVILSICLMLLIFSVSSSWGFEKQAHIEISKIALELYKELYPLKSKQIHESLTMFIDGSGKEDDISFSLQRLVNWHFYDPGSRLGHAWWGARKSNTKRFEYLAEKLTESTGKGLPDIYGLAGRLAHHIQDMSSPPHAVPIYHTNKDPFDKYATAEIAGVKLTSAQLDVVKNEQRNLEFETMLELLNAAATRTIDRVEKPVSFDGRLIASDWTGFWRKFELTGAECGQKPHKDFGCYGKNTFGIEVEQFTPPVYDRFYKEQIASAIEDTLRLLILLDRGQAKN
jgi:hypothetical protein